MKATQHVQTVASQIMLDPALPPMVPLDAKPLVPEGVIYHRPFQGVPFLRDWLTFLLLRGMAMKGRIEATRVLPSDDGFYARIKMNPDGLTEEQLEAQIREHKATRAALFKQYNPYAGKETIVPFKNKEQGITTQAMPLAQLSRHIMQRCTLLSVPIGGVEKDGSVRMGQIPHYDCAACGTPHRLGELSPIAIGMMIQVPHRWTETDAETGQREQHLGWRSRPAVTRGHGCPECLRRFTSEQATVSESNTLNADLETALATVAATTKRIAELEAAPELRRIQTARLSLHCIKHHQQYCAVCHPTPKASAPVKRSAAKQLAWVDVTPYAT